MQIEEKQYALDKKEEELVEKEEAVYLERKGIKEEEEDIKEAEMGKWSNVMEQQLMSLTIHVKKANTLSNMQDKPHQLGVAHAQQENEAHKRDI